MTRLLVLFEYATLNGGERSWLTTLDEIRRAGFEVTAAAPRAGPVAEELARRDVPLLAIEFHDSSGRRRELGDLRASLAEMIASHGTQLLHANSLNMSRLSGPVARASGIASLGYLRDILKLRRAAIEDLNCHRRLLAVSCATRDYHIAQGLEPDRVEVCHNGVDLVRFRPRPPTGYLHRELGIPTTAPLIGTIGQIGLRKGLDVLIESAAKLMRHWQSDTPAPHFLIIGERHSQKEESIRFEQQLHEAASIPPLKGQVHFLQWRSDIPDLLAELTLLVHPARQEPLGRVLLEAAAAGVAILATDVGGTREIFPSDQESARLVPPGDSNELRVALAQLLQNTALREQLPRNARRRICQAFDGSAAAHRLIAHYRSILD